MELGPEEGQPPCPGFTFVRAFVRAFVFAFEVILALTFSFTYRGVVRASDAAFRRREGKPHGQSLLIRELSHVPGVTTRRSQGARVEASVKGQGQCLEVDT